MEIEPEVPENAAAPIAPGLRAWLAPFFFVAGIGLVPWTLYLFATLPARHLQTRYYDLAWSGFDLALASLLVATGFGLLRGRLWVQGAATATATMLFCDAWFDVLSSRSGNERLFALALALGAELPTAAVCLMIARHAEEAAERTQRYASLARRLRRRGRAAVEAPAETS